MKPFMQRNPKSDDVVARNLDADEAGDYRIVPRAEAEANPHKWAIIDWDPVEFARD